VDLAQQAERGLLDFVTIEDSLDLQSDDHFSRDALELPYAFAHEEYEQILSDVAASIAPQLGWSPSEAG
jgi:hypothetical protein